MLHFKVSPRRNRRANIPLNYYQYSNKQMYRHFLSMHASYTHTRLHIFDCSTSTHVIFFYFFFRRRKKLHSESRFILNGKSITPPTPNRQLLCINPTQIFFRANQVNSMNSLARQQMLADRRKSKMIDQYKKL